MSQPMEAKDRCPYCRGEIAFSQKYRWIYCPACRKWLWPEKKNEHATKKTLFLALIILGIIAFAAIIWFAEKNMPEEDDADIKALKLQYAALTGKNALCTGAEATATKSAKYAENECVFFSALYDANHSVCAAFLQESDRIKAEDRNESIALYGFGSLCHDLNCIGRNDSLLCNTSFGGKIVALKKGDSAICDNMPQRYGNKTNEQKEMADCYYLISLSTGNASLCNKACGVYNKTFTSPYGRQGCICEENFLLQQSIFSNVYNPARFLTGMLLLRKTAFEIMNQILNSGSSSGNDLFCNNSITIQSMDSSTLMPRTKMNSEEAHGCAEKSDFFNAVYSGESSKCTSLQANNNEIYSRGNCYSSFASIEKDESLCELQVYSDKKMQQEYSASCLVTFAKYNGAPEKCPDLKTTGRYAHYSCLVSSAYVLRIKEIIGIQ
jgi:hypothetical protein